MVHVLVYVVTVVVGVRQRVASFMHQSPLDGNVTRRVKMAANVIDRFGSCIYCLILENILLTFFPAEHRQTCMEYISVRCMLNLLFISYK